MHLLKHNIAVLLLAVLFVSGCNKKADKPLLVEGNLQKQGATTYQYGTHILTTTNGPAIEYVLESNHLNLDPFVGRSVIATIINTHYSVENGPDLYDVISITAK